MGEKAHPAGLQIYALELKGSFSSQVAAASPSPEFPYQKVKKSSSQD